MSIRIIDLVWRKSQHSETALLVLLALASTADAETGESRASVDDLASMCKTTPRTIQRTLKKLEESREVTVHRSVGRGNTSRYWITIP